MRLAMDLPVQTSPRCHGDHLVAAFRSSRPRGRATQARMRTPSPKGLSRKSAHDCVKHFLLSFRFNGHLKKSTGWTRVCGGLQKGG